MKKSSVVVLAGVCLAAYSAPVWAFCVTGNPQGCSQPFAKSGSSVQSEGATAQQGFDAQTGNQWSTTSRKAGDFTFYSGISSGNSLGGRQRLFGSGLNGPGFNSHDQADSPNCALYGSCR